MTTTINGYDLTWDIHHTGDDDYDELYFAIGDRIPMEALPDLLTAICASEELDLADRRYLAGRLTEEIENYDLVNPEIEPLLYHWEDWEDILDQADHAPSFIDFDHDPNGLIVINRRFFEEVR